MHSPSATMEALVHTTATGTFGRMSETYGALAGFALVASALAIWFIEWRHRSSSGTSTRGVEVLSRPVTLSQGRIIVKLIPEAVVLALCTLVATAVIMRHDNNGSEPEDHVSKETWNEIVREWPILMTADTLLALQAMIRLVLCLSATFRHKEMDASPFANEPATFFLLANVSRVALLAISPWDCYHLDGPLGGRINFGFELAVLPLLVYLSRGLFQQGLCRVLTVAVAALAACTTAWCNRYMLVPGYEYMDALYSLSHCLELLAAVTFLGRTITLGSESAGAFTSFVHMLLPVQQSLSMYFLLTAFAEPLQNVPELVGAGRPFEVFEIAGVAQVGMYLFAAAMHLTFIASVDMKEPGSYLEIGLQLAEEREYRV